MPTLPSLGFGPGRVVPSQSERQSGRLASVERMLVEALGEKHGDARVRNAIAELRSIREDGMCRVAGCEFAVGHESAHPHGVRVDAERPRRFRDGDMRDEGDVARGQVTLLRGSALDVLRAFPGTTSTESVLAMHEQLTEAHEVIRELLQFVPYEKPEQGPLPQWITDARERATTAVKG